MRARAGTVALVVSSALACHTVDAASEPAPVAPAEAEGSLYDACGYSAVVNGTVNQMVQGFRHGLVASVPPDRPLPQAMLGRMDEIARSTLTEDALRAPLEAKFAALALEHRRGGLEWCRSRLGQRIQMAIAADLDVATDTERLEAFRESNENAPVRRRQLIDELSQAMSAADREMRTTLHVMSGMMALAMGIADPAARPNADLLAKLTRDYGPRIEALREQMEVMVQQQLLFTYRDLSDRELRQVIAFVGSDAGKALLDAESRGMQEGLVAALTDFVTAMSEAARAPSDTGEKRT